MKQLTDKQIKKLKSRINYLAYKEKQNALGRRPRPVWVTDQEWSAVKELITAMRTDKDEQLTFEINTVH